MLLQGAMAKAIIHLTPTLPSELGLGRPWMTSANASGVPFIRHAVDGLAVDGLAVDTNEQRLT